MTSSAQGSWTITRSLRTRLALLICALVVAVLVTFLWIAYRAVADVSVRAAGDRAENAATQLALILGQSAQQRFDEIKRVGGLPAVREYLQNPSDATRDAALEKLAALTGPTPQLIELWDDRGQRELVVPTPQGSESKLASAAAPAHAGLDPLQVAHGVVISEATFAIFDRSQRSAAVHPLGFLVVRRPAAVAPTRNTLNRLLGNGATVEVGNRSDDVWTDLETVVEPPPRAPARSGTREYVDRDGHRRIGALADIHGTPWAVWVDFPYAVVVAPARAFLGRMAIGAALFVVGAALLALALSARITRPLAEVTAVSEAIAAGEYSRRVTTTRRDEIGRLAAAFDAMADKLEAGYRNLEERVHERTVELKNAQDDADRANIAKSEFLSRMSHELRTPLNAILGFAQVLELDRLEPEQRENVHQILQGGRHLLALINEVIDISRIETGRLSLSPEPVSVRDVVAAAVALVKPLASQRGITIAMDGTGHDRAVHADRQRLNQILINLLSNAVKYNRLGGTVSIACTSGERDCWRIAVSDTGAGIPPAKLALLFQPFERLGTEQTSVEGTGLGLVLSRALAHAMGGTIGVDSTVDRGSTFWVELPKADPASDRPIPAVRDALPLEPAAARETIVLYIEDNASNVRLMERILRHRPAIRLLHALSGAEGLTMIRERHPDLVLLDMHLPDTSGEEVLRRIWEDPTSRRVPIVIVTADATPGLVRRLEAIGATAYLTKPLDIKRVVQLIDDITRPRPEPADV